MTIKEVAAQAGVSKMTASAVLSRQPQNTRFSEATRLRVLETARQLHYYPSAVAQGLTRRRMNSVGVVLSHQEVSLLDDPYVCGLLDGIMAVNTRHRQNTTVFTGQMWSDAPRSVPVFCDGRCDGLILISPRTDSDVVPALLAACVPFVLIHNTDPDPRVSSVGIDNVTPMFQVVQHLIAQGHRRIAFLGGDLQTRSAQERLEGYRRALAEAQIAAELQLVSTESYRFEYGYGRARRLLDGPRKTRPTALCCGSDKVALGAIAALREAGVRVPEEMSVTGFDDIPEAATTMPPLTTVRMPMRLLGHTAAEILLEQIAAGPLRGRKEVLPTQLVLRRSVVPPAG